MKSLSLFLFIFSMITYNKIYVYAGNKAYLSLAEKNISANEKPTTNKLLESYLEFSSLRHKILSQNLANVNTPGYKAEEVSISKENKNNLAKSKKFKLVSTHSSHMNGTKKYEEKFITHKLEDPYEIKPNGNNVSIAQQLTKLSQNQQNYNMALKEYNALNNLYSVVLGK